MTPPRQGNAQTDDASLRHPSSRRFEPSLAQSRLGARPAHAPWEFVPLAPTIGVQIPLVNNFVPLPHPISPTSTGIRSTPKTWHENSPDMPIIYLLFTQRHPEKSGDKYFFQARLRECTAGSSGRLRDVGDVPTTLHKSRAGREWDEVPGAKTRPVAPVARGIERAGGSKWEARVG